MTSVRIKMILKEMKYNCEQQCSCSRCDMNESGKKKMHGNKCLLSELIKELEETYPELELK
jgi:hypothetical protein